MISIRLKNIADKIKPFYLVKLLSAVFSQLGSLFLVYLLKPEDYGYLALIMSVAQLMFIVTSGWSSGVIINLGSRNFAKTGTYKDVIYYRTTIVIATFLVVSLLFVLFKSSISHFILKEDNYTLVYILFIGLILFDYASQLLYPGNKDMMQSIAELTTNTFLLILTFFVVRNITMYVYSYVLISSFFAVWVISFFFKYFGRQKVTWVKNDFFLIFKYSAWQILSVVGIYVINIGMNYVFVFNHQSAKDIGLYNFAFKLFSGFSPFFALFGIIIPKWIYNTDKELLGKQLSKRITMIILLLAVFYICIMLVLKPFIMLIGKTDYVKSTEYYMLLFPAFIFMSYSNLMNTVIANSPYYKMAQFAIVVQFITLMVVSYPIVHFWGVNGAIIATTFSYVLCAVYFYVLYKNKFVKNLATAKW